MAPECWEDNCTYTPKVDVWSVGAIFYVMLTGSSLLSHLEADGEEIFLGTLPVKGAACAHAEIRPLSGVLAHIPMLARTHACTDSRSHTHLAPPCPTPTSLPAAAAHQTRTRAHAHAH